MNCDLFKMLIQRYHDGDLDLAGMAEYENHMRSCDGCRRLDSQFTGIFEALEGLELLQPSPDFNKNVMAGVDISRYKVRVSRKVWLSVRSFWRGLPAPVRATGIIASVFALFISVYTPFLLMMISAGKKLVAMTGSGLYIIRRIIDEPALMINYLNSFEKYRVAGKVLFKTIDRQIEGIPLTYYGLTAVAAAIVLFLVIRMTRTGWKKGEPHVSIF